MREVVQELSARYGCPYIVHLEDNEEFLFEANTGISRTRIPSMSCGELDQRTSENLSHPIRYREFLNARAITDYQSVTGNFSVHILERSEGAITHFITLTFWKDFESIKAFAGEDVEAAKYYPEDSDFLLDFEPTVVHYEVVGQS